MPQEPTVYIVDDDSFIRDLVARVFANVGIAVRTFGSAADLLAQADLHSQCVLVLDVRMPDMSGPELQMVLRERGIDRPIIFLTGFSDVPVAVSAMRNGALDFLIKPFDTPALIDRVRQAFARHDARDDRPSRSDRLRRLATLTPREREVFDLMVTGQSSKEIARTLDCSFRTIDIHRGRVMTKMGAESLAQLVRMNIDLTDRTGSSQA
jgi:two-component system, LuxR family, response regulator FixJ